MTDEMLPVIGIENSGDALPALTGIIYNICPVLDWHTPLVPLELSSQKVLWCLAGTTMNEPDNRFFQKYLSKHFKQFI
jgi:hypothetical protein